jgi:biopolymer transport protein ExbD
MRLPGTARVGIFALCLGIVVFASVHYWVNTRTLVPLDIPVTLAPGHIRTGDFKINVEAYLSVQIRFPYGSAGCGDHEALRTRRLTPIGGQAVSVPGWAGATTADVTEGTYLGTFLSKPGHYNLDIEVLSATQYLDTCRPRLDIVASYYDFNKWDSIQVFSFWLSAFCEVLGVSMLFVFATTHFRKNSLEEVRLRIFNTDAPIVPVPAADLKPERSFPLLLIFGIFGVVAGVVLFAATKRWYDSLDFVVVDKPVSLGQGHIKTGNFQVRIKGQYDISIESELPYLSYNCLQYQVLKTRWVVRQDGRVIAHLESPGYEWEEPGAPITGTNLFGFDADPGTYNLDVEQLSDGRCLDTGNPRIRVFLSGGDRAEYDDLNAWLELVALLSFALGLTFLFAYRFARLRRQPQVSPLSPSWPVHKPAWGITGLRFRQFPAQSAWSMNPVKNLPTIALACSLTWFVWLVPMWIVYAAGQTRIGGRGLLVSIPRKGVPIPASSEGLTAPLVRIDSNRRVYLNYKETAREDLPKKLEQELRSLPTPVVYFDADSDILFMDAAWALDIIQGLGAKAILITPGSKAEK